MAPVGDALAKLLGGRIDVAQLVAIRMGVQVLILFPIVRMLGISLRMQPRMLWLSSLRAALHIIGIGFMFLSLRHLPLADAVAIAFVMPFIMLLLGHVVLGEEVGSRRVFACAVGFMGTLMVIQPNLLSVGWPALLPLIVALDFALFMLVTRAVAKDVDPMALQVVSGGIACLILAPLFLVFSPLGVPGFALTSPQYDIWGLVLLMGLVGTGAHLMMTWALRFAPSATLAPMQYLEIPMATAVGWFVFRDFPNGLALAGIVVTIAAGLYIIAREQRLSRKEPAKPEAESPEV
jgi:drug/metabolite transporter (DMT)-like permease